jgi:hypothetical protein
VFVIDERDAASRSSINQKGHYQTDLMGLAVGVKDSVRHADKWVYYFLNADGKKPRPCPRATLAGRATALMPPSSTRLCNSIPR